MNLGNFYIVGASIIWGLLPIYLKYLHYVPMTQLIGHRIFWSCLVLLGIILLTGQWQKFCVAIATPRVWCLHFIAALLLGINWLIFVWATNANFLIETSLGYYMDPLVTILIGVIFLCERMHPLQWISLGIAIFGVLYLTYICGTFPWIALTVAFTFGIYGAIKKITPLGALYGLTLETIILFFPAMIYLVYVEIVGQGVFLHIDTVPSFLLVSAGLVTAIPLLMFASATKRISLFSVGFLQYLTPTVQFLLGVLIYKEPFLYSHLIGFSIIWVALIIFIKGGKS